MKSPKLPALSKRNFLLSSAVFALGTLGGVGGSLFWASNSTRFLKYIKDQQTAALDELSNEVLPPEGVQLEISFGDSIQRLVDAGAIFPWKFKKVYDKRGGLPQWVEELFTQASSQPITVSAQTAPFLLNLLWPLGMATKTLFNEKSELNSPRLANFASTGGWTLGQAKDGGGHYYFNNVSSIDLTSKQEKTVLEIAENSYRPCCNNSTFFQDCNHGSALLGLYELAASQGAGSDELYALGRTANSFWYPEKYLETAYFFQKLKNQSWNQVNGKTILAKQYSSIEGWNKNIHQPMVDAGFLASARRSGVNCGV